MVREPVIDGSNRSGEDPERDLRPKRIDEMVGQHEVIARLRIAIEAARVRGEALGHLLLDGPPGLGKTTFATCIPREMQVGLQMTSGAILKAPRDLVPYLTNAEEHSVLFIDEIHRIPKIVEEYLYTAMEDFRVDIILGDGINARTHNLWIKPFTLIGATTRSGMLTGPLRDRFQIREHLGFYSDAELTQIIVRNATQLNTDIAPQAADEIARRSRGTPRIANNRLRWVRDYAQTKADGIVTMDVTGAALEMLGIDRTGMDSLDREYLKTMIRVFEGGPVGIDALAHTMNTSKDTLEDEVEPFLLRNGFVVRTPRGRMVTNKTYEHLQVLPPESGVA
ncbi:MAG: Holliday junction branch migration DNA helicase RuvB [Planctomycetaceae bacterium]|nr:Holliday junction branch migration DNA helicase RuvB [Planctomycetaceae bacterium]HAA70521.1 Holliday junction branch migration DNA helicase RuvB [Planctomycetaceae bacterium]|tara:strand:+ start:12243 stop:13253 length:1011 start_codon:yes stop_codon:yes gene_type:complete